MTVGLYELLLDNKLHPKLNCAQEFEIDGCLNNAEFVVDIMNQCFNLSSLAEEFVYLISATTKNQAIAIFQIAHGTVDAAVVDRSRIFTRLLLSGAANFFVIHNHPSGCSNPSHEDKEMFSTLRALSNLIGVTMVDFIIIGGNSYYSFLS